MNLDDVKLVTHRECPDGSACAVLFAAAGGNLDNVIFVSPNHVDVDEVAKELYYNWDGRIWFADVSISVDAAKLLSGRKQDITLLDHHKSAIPLVQFSFCHIDQNNFACGSKLFYEFLTKNGANLRRYREFIDNIDDMDRWARSIDGSSTISSLHGLYGQKLFINRFKKNPSVDLTEIERALIEIDLEKQTQYIEQKRQQVNVQTRIVGGEKINVGFVNAGGPYRSILGDTLCNDPSLGIDMVVMVNGDFISLRSNKMEIDCSILAELNGGGGHQGAAGCNLAKILGKDLLSIAIDNIKFE